MCGGLGVYISRRVVRSYPFAPVGELLLFPRKVLVDHVVALVEQILFDTVARLALKDVGNGEVAVQKDIGLAKVGTVVGYNFVPAIQMGVHGFSESFDCLC